MAEVHRPRQSAGRDRNSGARHPIDFTNGTSTWPDRDYAPGILGIGGQFVGGVPRGGFAYIDRTAIDSHILREFVATHEILHAAGFGVHVEEALYPDSIMSPEVDRGLAVVPRFYLTIDGEVDLVDLPEGPLPFPVTAGDLGVWEADAFHLLANHDDGEDDWLRFGAGYRNGQTLGLGQRARNTPRRQSRAGKPGDLERRTTRLYRVGAHGRGQGADRRRSRRRCRAGRFHGA